MKRLVEFYLDCGRMGNIDGRFVLDESQWSKLQQHINEGTEVYFGEVLGKHSEIYCELAQEHITTVTKLDEDWLAQAIKMGIDLDTGFNPLTIIEQQEDEEKDEKESSEYD